MNKNQNHRTYQRITSAVFRKTKEKYGGLSNMAGGFPLSINDIKIRTSEALYQACRFPHLQDVQYIIIQQRSPMTAKMKSKPHRKKTRPDWFNVRVNIMRWCLRIKLVQNWKKFGSLLISTGDRPIVEESKKDDFWGAKPKGEDILVGKNVLGRLLMELREQLLSPNAELLTKIIPLEIPDFLLYGKPIGVIEGPIYEDIIIKDIERRPKVEELIQQDAAITNRVTEDQHLFDSKPSNTDTNQEDESKGSLIPKECKRLAEVDFPIAKVSSSSLLETARRASHPKGLHLWWARRPLAACRSVLLALLLPDPADPNCPKHLLKIMREVLMDAPGRPLRWEASSKTPEGLRKIALEFIAEFSHPDNAYNSGYIRCVRNLVNKLNSGEAPLVYDSFAGGGSIPLEALRLGCEAVGSDLNPIACLILKSELELIPRYGYELSDKLIEAGKVIEERYRACMKDYFVEEGSSAIPIAYFWARQATCESPNCGVKFPLASSFWLCKKKGREAALRMSISSDEQNLVWEIFNPRKDSEVPLGTILNGRGRCPKCDAALTNDRLRSQLGQYNGGIERARLIAAVTLNSATGQKLYRNANSEDIKAAEKAILDLRKIMEKNIGDTLSPIPDESIPNTELRRVSAPLYGCNSWQDLFIPRQRLSLYMLINEIKKYVAETGKNNLLPLLALAFGKVLRHWNSNAKWHTKSENVAGAFGRQAIPMTYFFPEQSPLLSDGAGSWLNAVKSVAASMQTIVGLGNLGQSFHADACNVPLPSDSVNVWFTDPPYYDAVAYAHLADFFYVWIRRLLPDDPLFRTPLIEKAQECVVDRPHSQSPSHKGADWFEKKVGDAMTEGRRFLNEDGIASVVFAHNTTEGWEAIITGMLKAGWVITASWPIMTERRARLNARDNASLAASVHLICRPRAEDAPVGDWAKILNELPKVVGDWMERLQTEGIRGADLVFACIGPALEIYSQYLKVEDPEGNEIPLGGDPEAKEPHRRGYLAYVWETVGRIALEQVLGTEEAKARNSAAGALEEDARLTALFLWTRQSTNGNQEAGKEKKRAALEDRPKGYNLIFDVVRRFAQPLGINLPKWEGRIIETKKGVVRLLPVSERSKQLFGQEDARSVAYALEREPKTDPQILLFPELEAERIPKVRGRGRRRSKKGIISDASFEESPEATTLDRVHAAMLLQSGGQANALRAMIKSEQERGSEFLRLANALSALYPKGSEEKRLVRAMLLAVPR
ncbi:NADAR domain-containing protein [Thermodesulfobacteriota bacterium]